MKVGGTGAAGTSYDSEQGSALQLAGKALFTAGFPAYHSMPSVFGLACLTATFDPAETSYGYLLRAVSDDETEAFANMQAVLQGKVGTPVASFVLVDAFIEVTIEGDYVKVVSSLIDEFTHYTATLNGFVVADLGIGLNAALSHGPNGWVSVTSYMPLALLQGGETLYLFQQGTGAAGPVFMGIK